MGFLPIVGALIPGILTEATIYASDKGRDSLPASIKAYFVHTSPNTNVLNIQRWAFEELNVLPYPETRVYKEIRKRGVRAFAIVSGSRPIGA